MRTSRLVVTGALSALILLPMGAVAQAPHRSVTVAGTTFTATINARANVHVQKVPVRMGALNVPAGTSVNGYFLTENELLTPIKSTPGWLVLPTNFKVTDLDGEHTIYAFAKATGGVVSAVGSDTVFVDRVAPSIDSVDTPTDSTSRNILVDLTYSDPGVTDDPVTGSDVAKVAIVNGTTPPISSSLLWVTPAPTVAFKLSKGNGDKTITAFARDAAGNVSAGVSVHVQLDLGTPVAHITLPATTNVAKVSVNVTSTDPAGAGIQGFILKADDSVPPVASDTTWKVKPTSFTLTGGEGVKTVYVWSKDNNGTVSAEASATTVWDATAPLVSFTSFPVGTATNRSISVTFAATDIGGSGVAKYALVNGATVPTLGSTWKTYTGPSMTIPDFKLSLGNGSKTVTVFVRDVAGNVSAVSAGDNSDTITMTLAAPTIVLNLPTYAKSLTNVSVSAVATDPGGSGIAGYFISTSNSTPLASAAGWKVSLTNTGTLFSGADGSKTLYGWVKDNNGTVSSVSSDSVIIDTTRPTATLSLVSTTLTVGGSDTNGITDYALVETPSAIPAAPAYPNPTIWKSTSSAAISTITVTQGTRITLFTRDAAGNISTASDGVNSLIVP